MFEIAVCTLFKSQFFDESESDFNFLYQKLQTSNLLMHSKKDRHKTRLVTRGCVAALEGSLMASPTLHLCTCILYLQLRAYVYIVYLLGCINRIYYVVVTLFLISTHYTIILHKVTYIQSQSTQFQYQKMVHKKAVLNVYQNHHTHI